MSRASLFLSTLSLRRATYGRINDISRLIFLSTLSLRRATVIMEAKKVENQYFYPRSPCGERRYTAAAGHYSRAISIHALLAESDNVTCGDWHKLHHFYPRSPCGERLRTIRGAITLPSISIHALLAESDYTMTTTICIAWKFLSTLSLRRATVVTAFPGSANKFLSTLSLRRATRLGAIHYTQINISIHALLAESDAIDVFLAVWAVISIHALLAESDY